MCFRRGLMISSLPTTPPVPSLPLAATSSYHPRRVLSSLLSRSPVALSRCSWSVDAWYFSRFVVKTRFSGTFLSDRDIWKFRVWTVFVSSCFNGWRVLVKSWTWGLLDRTYSKTSENIGIFTPLKVKFIFMSPSFWKFGWEILHLQHFSFLYSFLRVIELLDLTNLIVLTLITWLIDYLGSMILWT